MVRCPTVGRRSSVVHGPLIPYLCLSFIYHNMIKSFLAVITISSCFLVSCGTQRPNGETSENANTGADSSLPAVETKQPNTDYKPAFAGQTRVAGVRTTSKFEGRMVTNGLKNPWAIAVLPDRRLLINEKGGNMRIVTPSGQVGAPITGLPQVATGGQGGLLGLALDSDFEQNRMVFWVYSEPVSGGSVTSVAKGNLSADFQRMENATVIYRALPSYNNSLHFGGRVILDRSGNLFISTGDRSDKVTRPQAQDLNSGLGKVIRITKDGQPAAGNPFIGRSGVRPEIYTYGHRNVQGLAFHPETGDLWQNEFGPRAGDELNLIKPGLNYGWPVISYGYEYNGDRIPGGITQQSGLEQPVYYWDPVLSPSGMTFYNADEIPEWKNNLFIGGLNSNHIARLVIRNNRVVGEERLLSAEGQRWRDVVQGKEGELYAVTDEGRLYRIGKK